MLQTERDAYYSNAAEQAEGQMKHCDFNTADQYPYDVHYNGQTTAVICIRLDFTAERPERKNSDLNKLQTERDTDNAYTE